MFSKRIFFQVGLFLSLMFLWQAWQNHQQGHSVATQENSGLLSIPDGDSKPALPSLVSEEASKNIIKIYTDTLSLHVNLNGGSIDHLLLNQYTTGVDEKQKQAVLFRNSERVRMTQSGLESDLGPDINGKGPGVFSSPKSYYSMAEGKEKLDVPLVWKKNGLTVVKHLVFTKGSYAVEQYYTIHNQSKQNWTGRPFAQILTKAQEASGMFGMRTFIGPAISSSDKPYEKLPFDDLSSRPLNKDITGGWLASQEHYFLAAWVPPKTSHYHFYSQSHGDGLFTLGMVGDRFTVPVGKKMTTTKTMLYAGPEIAKNLEAVAPGTLKLTIDYGRLWLLSAPIFTLLEFIHSLVGNWGVAIILITCLMKLAFYRLSEKSYTSMAKMRELQPKLEALKQKHGDDREKLGVATMTLYKEEKVNPLGGCLPMLLQLPIFLALYWVLIESIELRQAPFFGWIQDLSVKDPYFILPVLMGLSMFFQQKMSPKPQDPMQAKMMMFLPVMMTFLFISFPAGLVLYWFVNNVLSALQQWFIMNKHQTKNA